MRRNGPVPEWRDRKLAELWEAGHPLKEIARHIGVSIPTVSTRRKKIGLPDRCVDGSPMKTTILENEISPAVGAILTCLSCGNKFGSKDKKANRVCDPCKSTRSWRNGNDFTHDSPRFKRMGQG